MLWVVTFSGFLPSLTSSSVVWVEPSPGHKPSKVASNQILFMITLLGTSSTRIQRCAPLYTAPAEYVENSFASLGSSSETFNSVLVHTELPGTPGAEACLGRRSTIRVQTPVEFFSCSFRLACGIIRPTRWSG